MLRLQNIQVQLSRPVFAPGKPSTKFLRISVGNVVKKTSAAAKIINEKSIQWQQPINLPLLYNRDFGFQIYDRHQFGFNPQEFQTLLVGTLSIMDITQKQGTWEIFTAGQEKIGFLSAAIVSKNNAAVRKESPAKVAEKTDIQASQVVNNESSFVLAPAAAEKKVLRVVSIVARIPNSTFKKGYIKMQVGDQTIQTKTIKSRAGELVFIDAIQIPLDAADTAVRVQVFTVNINKEENPMGEGTLQLISPKPAKRVVLMKEGFEAGEVYIDSRIVNQSKANSIMASHSKIFNEASEMMDETYQRSRSITPSRSIDFTKLEHFGIYNTSRVIKPALDSSMVSTLSSRRRNSVMNHNNNIVFPKEKRFMQYGDRKNDRVSYLHEQSFEFRSPGLGRNYQGKSIGYGGKVDFTRGGHNVPGVGNYKLPSIWDRY